jgi:hypothetical protein
VSPLPGVPPTLTTTLVQYEVLPVAPALLKLKCTWFWWQPVMPEHE